ncbi:MAG: hypothetical protein AB7J63_18910 [Vicinamibacterales bacterium]
MLGRRAPVRVSSLAAACLFVVASLAVALAALEAALRLWDGIPLFSGENFVAKRIDIIRANGGPVVHDALLGWKLTDNFGGPGFLTGEYGIRMNSDAVTPPVPDAILAVGDSFTAGSEVVNSETFPAHLERLLGRRVLNAASGAWGVDQMVLRAEQLIPALHPSVLVVGVFDQDIDRNNHRIFGGGAKPYFVIENGELALKGVPVPRIEKQPDYLGFWRSLLGHSYLLDWIVQRAGLLPRLVGDRFRFERVQDDGAQISGLLMRRLAALRDRLGIRVLVVLLYSGESIDSADSPPEWMQPTIAEARASGLEVVDMFPILRQIYLSDHAALKRYYVMHDSNRGYGHMSSAGNLLVAQAIQAALSALP